MMEGIGDITIKGKSGKQYGFTVHPFKTRLWPIAAVYVVSRRKLTNAGRWSHTLIYIGETENLQKRFEYHHQAKCIEEQAPNRLCIHRDPNEASRKSKEEDILANYSTKCNE